MVYCLNTNIDSMLGIDNSENTKIKIFTLIYNKIIRSNNMFKLQKPNFKVKHPFAHLWKSIVFGILLLVCGIGSLSLYNYFKDDNKVDAASVALSSLYTGGDGSRANPFLIDDWEKFVALQRAYNVSMYFKLTKDITISRNLTTYWVNGTNVYNSSTSGATNLYAYVYWFQGVFDGDGHTITVNYGHVTDDGSASGFVVPLFQYVRRNSVIANVTVRYTNTNLKRMCTFSSEDDNASLRHRSFFIDVLCSNTLVSNCHLDFTKVGTSKTNSYGPVLYQVWDNFAKNLYGSAVNGGTVTVGTYDGYSSYKPGYYNDTERYQYIGHYGILVGYVMNTDDDGAPNQTSIINCSVTGRHFEIMLRQYMNVGGIVGGCDIKDDQYNSLYITNCHFKGRIWIFNQAAGAWVCGTIDNNGTAGASNGYHRGQCTSDYRITVAGIIGSGWGDAYRSTHVNPTSDVSTVYITNCTSTIQFEIDYGSTNSISGFHLTKWSKAIDLCGLFAHRYQGSGLVKRFNVRYCLVNPITMSSYPWSNESASASTFNGAFARLGNLLADSTTAINASYNAAYGTLRLYSISNVYSSSTKTSTYNAYFKAAFLTYTGGNVAISKYSWFNQNSTSNPSTTSYTYGRYRETGYVNASTNSSGTGSISVGTTTGKVAYSMLASFSGSAYPMTWWDQYDDSNVFCDDYADVIEVTTPDELGLLCYYESNFSGQTIKLMNDIDMSGKIWIPFVNFQGTFDGNGYTIKNLYIHTIFDRDYVDNNDIDYYGFFGQLGANAIVRNLTLSYTRMDFVPLFINSLI